MRYEVVKLDERRFVLRDLVTGKLLRARFHRPEQADEHALRLRVRAVLRLVQPEVMWADYPGRVSAWRLTSSDYYGVNERVIAHGSARQRH